MVVIRHTHIRRGLIHSLICTESGEAPGKRQMPTQPQRKRPSARQSRVAGLPTGLRATIGGLQDQGSVRPIKGGHGGRFRIVGFSCVVHFLSPPSKCKRDNRNIQHAFSSHAVNARVLYFLPSAMTATHTNSTGPSNMAKLLVKAARAGNASWSPSHAAARLFSRPVSCLRVPGLCCSRGAPLCRRAGRIGASARRQDGGEQADCPGRGPPHPVPDLQRRQGVRARGDWGRPGAAASLTRVCRAAPRRAWSSWTPTLRAWRSRRARRRSSLTPSPPARTSLPPSPSRPPSARRST